jgi:cytochrome b6-f complex iron-sulfur subunit
MSLDDREPGGPAGPAGDRSDAGGAAAGSGGGGDASAPGGDAAQDERARRIAEAKRMAQAIASARSGQPAAGGAPAAGGTAPGGAPAAGPGAAATPARDRDAKAAAMARVAAAAAARAAQEGGASASGADTSMTRRSMLRWLMWGSVASWFALAGGSALAMFWPNHVSGFGGIIDAGPKDNFSKVNGGPWTIGQAHAYVVNPGPGLLALWWRCVHLGCTVPWVASENDFHCPCHGSVYLYTGERVAGPAPRSLDLFPIQIDSKQHVLIHANPNVVFQRLHYEKVQCYPLSKSGTWGWTKGHVL